MANVMTVDSAYTRDREKFIRYNVVLSGAYVQAVRGANTGEVLDLTVVVSTLPKADQFWGVTGPKRGTISNIPASYIAKIIPGADRLHWLLQIFSAIGTELVAGAYPAGLTADLDFYVEFTGGLQS